MRKLKETVADVEWLVSEWDYNTNSALGIFPDKIGSQSNTYVFVCVNSKMRNVILSRDFSGATKPCRGSRLHKKI